MGIRRTGLPLAALLLVPAILRADIVSVGSVSVTAGGTVSVPVGITGASDLYAFQFDLSFDPTILQLQSIAEGLFLATAGTTIFLPGTIDNTGGSATLTASTLFGAIMGASGDGTFAIFDFLAVNPGLSTLTLSNIILLDSVGKDIPFQTSPGSVRVNAVPEVNSIWLLVTVAACCALLARRRRNAPAG